MTWTKTRLKYLCVDAGQYGLNVSSQDYTAHGHRLIRTSDIDETGRLRSRDGAVFVDVPPSARHELESGDLLLSRSGTLGRALLLGELEEPSTFAGYLVRFRPLPTTEPRFMAYVAASSGFQAAIEADAVTSTIQNFNAERYANITVSLPPLDEQCRIANFLDTETSRIDRLVEAQKSVARVLKERRGRVLEEVLIRPFIRPGDPVSWCPLGYLTEHSRPIMYGIVLPGPNVDDGVPIVKGGDVATGRLSLALLHKTTREIEAGFVRSRLRAGDLVIAIRGGVGEVAMVPGEIAGANLTQDAARIAPGPGVHGEWLELVLQAPTIEAQIRSRITGATITGINIWDLRRVLVPQVSVEDQLTALKQAGASLALMSELVAATERQLALLDERRQALITAAVTGQIDVSTEAELASMGGTVR